MAGRYKITEVVYVKLEKNHIPYFAYCIVEGPRGGKYLLDTFNAEQLAKKVTGLEVAFPLRNIVGLWTHRGNKISYRDKALGSDAELREFAIKAGYYPIIRKTKQDIMEKIKESIVV